MKAFKIVLLIVGIVLIGIYGYYSFLAYNIYQSIAVYEKTGNKMAVDLTKKIIKEKYPYSIHYFMIR